MQTVYMSPNRLDEALTVLSAGGEHLLLAGGTDIGPDLNRHRRPKPQSIICLAHIAELKQIAEQGQGIAVGSLTSHAEICASSLVERYARALYMAAATLGSPAVRNVGTIGGNLVTASPTGDTCVAALALDGEMILKSSAETRRIPAAEFFVSKKQTALQPNEILYGLWLSKAAPGLKASSFFVRQGTLKGASIAIMNVAVKLECDAQGICQTARVAMGAVAPVPTRMAAVEKALEGKKIDAQLAATAAELLKDNINPITDVYASAWYRRQIAPVLVKRAILGAANIASGQEG